MLRKPYTKRKYKALAMDIIKDMKTEYEKNEKKKKKKKENSSTTDTDTDASTIIE